MIYKKIFLQLLQLSLHRWTVSIIAKTNNSIHYLSFVTWFQVLLFKHESFYYSIHLFAHSRNVPSIAMYYQ